jgi:uncharacterized protein
MNATQSAATAPQSAPEVIPAKLLRIFIGELAHHGTRPLYEVIVLKAREMKLAGATVLRGPLGFGYSTRLHKASLLSLSEDLSLVIEIVDMPEKIDAFLPVLDELMTSGLVTLETVQVVARQLRKDSSHR